MMKEPIKLFPIMGQWSDLFHVLIPGFSIPWEMLEKHEARAKENHGGLSPCEAVAILKNERYQRMPFEQAFYELSVLVAEFKMKKGAIWTNPLDR